MVRSAIHELKYHNLRAIAPALAVYLADCARARDIVADCVVPVPLHAQHGRRRGYNQAELLARAFARSQYTPLAVHALRRKDGQTSQVRTRSAAERQRNVANAFTCTDQSFSGKRILVIDDVCTTGATMEACAVALRSAGALDVSGLTVAREV